MKIRIDRYWSDKNTTIGKLYIDGTFQCYTLEDEKRDFKIKGETRIPAGTYRLALRYSPRFSPRYKHDMLWIQNVPGFQFILIHPGNSEKDTDGCILVGTQVDGDKLINSRKAYDILYKQVIAEVKASNTWIEIVDLDGKDKK